MDNALTARIAQAHAAALSALPAQVLPAEQRRAALERFIKQGLPSNRNENWRYSNLRSLEHAQFAPRTGGATLTAADLPPPIEGYARYIFVDGVFAPQLSAAAHPALRSAAGTAFAPTHDSDMPFALLNDAFALDGATIDAGAEPLCLEVLFVATADASAGASYPRLTLNAGPNARVGLIERHLSRGSEANFVNSAVQVQLARGASVDHYRVQDCGNKAIWMDSLSAQLHEDAAYRVHLANLGAESARSTLQVQLTGARAELAMHAVSVADGKQTQDVFATVEHAAPATRTEQNFRGIAGGESQAAFNGRIVVREGAAGARSHQSLRGLLAGPSAEIDVRPQLEIYTDDVQCSHGATAGKLDDAMLFYLLSRGLDHDTAQRLLKWAFLVDVVARVSVPALRRQIEESLAGHMSEAAALKELL